MFLWVVLIVVYTSVYSVAADIDVYQNYSQSSEVERHISNISFHNIAYYCWREISIGGNQISEVTLVWAVIKTCKIFFEKLRYNEEKLSTFLLRSDSILNKYPLSLVV